MSSRLVPFLLALSLLLNGFILAGFAYRTWIAPPEIARMGPPPGPGGPGRAGPLEMLSQDLKLDESQRQALKGLFDKYANERRERFRQIQQVREAMVSELKKPDFDIAQIDSLVDQMTKLRAEQQKENLGSIAQLSGQLRPDQRERLHEILADRYGGPGNRPPGGPPRQPGAERPSQ
jgi:Spy/CpxP family protein refolding chaperone